MATQAKTSSKPSQAWWVANYRSMNRKQLESELKRLGESTVFIPDRHVRRVVALEEFALRFGREPTASSPKELS